MLVSDFQFDLPDELIARYPLAERSASRLLCLSGRDGRVAHRQFRELPELIAPAFQRSVCPVAAIDIPRAKPLSAPDLPFR